MTNKTQSSSYESMQAQQPDIDNIDSASTTTAASEAPITEETATASDALNSAADANKVQELENTIQKLTQELRDTKLRTMAEIKNLQDRYQREQDTIKKYAHQYFARDVIDTVDALEQAQQTTTGEQQEGIALIASMLEKTLIKHQIEPINPMDQPFDHNLHEVMTTIPNNEAENDQIVQVIQKGYKIKDRLLRPARVIIAKNTATEPKES